MNRFRWLLVVGLMLLDASVATARKKDARKEPKKPQEPPCVTRCRQDHRKYLANCHDPSCEEQVNAGYQACWSACSYAPTEEDSAPVGNWKEKVLPVVHHAQSTPVWCWAASIAMAAEFLKKEPVSDCDVASKLDIANGGEGACCNSAGKLRDNRCFRGRYSPEMTTVMKAYGLTATQFDRPMTWEELTHSIDAGYPIVAAFQYWSSGHAVVIVGYREPSTVLIDDPWEGDLRRPKSMPYRNLVPAETREWSGSHLWAQSWYFPKDEVSGYLANRHASSLVTPPPLAQVSKGPAQAKVSIEFPDLVAGETRKFVESRAKASLDTVRACYEQALSGKEQPPAHAAMRITFAVQGGSPTFIMTKDAGGLPSSVGACVGDAMARWSGLFPKRKDFDESQSALITFDRLSETGMPGAPMPTTGAGKTGAR